MRRTKLAASVVLLLIAGAAVGCGGSDAPTAAERAQAAAKKLAADQAAIRPVISRTVDQDLCVDYTAKFLDGSTVEECNGDGTLGVLKSDYKIKSIKVNGNTAVATLTLKPGGERTYRMVRQGGKWKVNDLDEKFQGKLGDGFLRVSNFTEDGTDINEHVTVRLLAIKDPAKPPPYNSPGPGKRWVRTKLRLHSTGKDTFNFNTQDFKLIACNGGRYEAFGYPFEPTLGNGGVDLSEGDTVVGYLGFKVQKNRKVCELRLTDPFNGAPIRWKLR